MLLRVLASSVTPICGVRRYQGAVCFRVLAPTNISTLHVMFCPLSHPCMRPSQFHPPHLAPYPPTPFRLLKAELMTPILDQRSGTGEGCRKARKILTHTHKPVPSSRPGLHSVQQQHCYTSLTALTPLPSDSLAFGMRTVFPTYPSTCIK